MKPHHLSIDIWHLLLLVPILFVYTVALVWSLDRRYRQIGR